MVATPAHTRALRLLARAADHHWPLPASDSPASLLAWLGEPGPRDPSGVSRYLAELWRERADLRETFPGIAFDAGQRHAYISWARAFAVEETGMPVELVPEEPDPTDMRLAETFPEPGISVVGFLRTQMGLGAAARRMVSLCRSAEPIVQAIPYDHTSSALLHDWPDVRLEDIRLLDVSILCVNGTELPRLCRALGAPRTRATYRIGLWFWELETLSEAMSVGLGHLDEVWVTSDFVAEAVRRRLNTMQLALPVHVVPLGVDVGSGHPHETGPGPGEPGEPGAADPATGLPDGLLIGCSFDYASTIERKNPIGTIRAFRKAFPVPFDLGTDAGPRLIVKAHGSSDFDASRARIREAVSGRPDIVVLDTNFSEDQQHAFYRKLAVYVSLHRSEGYGLGPLEAMAHGIPTVATAYSGNLTFMTPENSWLIPAGRSVVPMGTDHYPPGSVWAEPDLNAAAAILRTIIDNRDSPTVRSRAERGRADVAALVSGRVGVDWIRARVAEIRAAR